MEIRHVNQSKQCWLCSPLRMHPVMDVPSQGDKSRPGSYGTISAGELTDVVQAQEPFVTGIRFPGRAGVVFPVQVQRRPVGGRIETKETVAQFLVTCLFDFHQVH